MSNDWLRDVEEMHRKFKFHSAVKQMDEHTKRNLLDFRIAALQEELDELKEARDAGDAEEVLDALIDITVFALGTMDLYQTNAREAWNDVFRSNMDKERGLKPGRPNPFGMPDLLKPEGWVGPDHKKRAGLLYKIFG